MKIDRQYLREAILLILEDAGSTGLRAASVQFQLRGRGAGDLNDAAMDTELTYLRDEGFVDEVESAVSVGSVNYRLSSTGRKYLEKQKLI